VIIKSRVRTRDKKIKEGEQIDFELRFKVPSTTAAYMITEVFPPNETKTKWGFYGAMDYPIYLMLPFCKMEKLLVNDLYGIRKSKGNFRKKVKSFDI
jgi:hypothetical protein